MHVTLGFRINVLASVAASSFALVGCSAAPATGMTLLISEPAYDQFVGGNPNGSGVHVFLENQCGTLDCHGQMNRPLRLYSVDGLRAPNDTGIVSGIGRETSAELYSNFLAVVSLEPEEMSRVVAGIDAPTQLLLLKKPMGLESHKGGTRIILGDPMYRCLTSWLLAPSGQEPFDTGSCDQAAALP